ncbi:VOC family protein [Polynucleobacter sp. MG-28-Ekke-A2]|uniref:VOC family protein n=1 Tax=Polynucleobacter sp. MG-28-Ekke-A2 TaxID=3108276 RepID=UPI002B23DDC3|nr:VOC family protein [Polynucleobacter sp. MG-28-Ekke-A2]MEA9602667.1 VOC family protein [Polynucleobacter sp. MG-28-Ekke-A2]
MKKQSNFIGIDHLAIAVPDINMAVNWLRDILGFNVEETRETQGKHSGMKSAVLRLGPITLVVTEGIGETSQTSQYVKKYGPGIQHIAFGVRNIESAIEDARLRGLKFSSDLIASDGLSQIFSLRDGSTGMMIELIERNNFNGFRDENVQKLFDTLESKDIC